MEHPRQLIDTQRRMILCPRCELEQPMRDYAILGMSPLYAELLAQVYRCKLCDHLFAPRGTAAANQGELNRSGISSKR
jgi:hypothetical protein